MKISCLPVSLYDDIIGGKMTFEQWTADIKAVGYDAVDFSSLFLREHNPVYYQGIQQQLGNAGVPLNMLTTYSDFSNPDSPQRQRELSYIEMDMAQASQLGANYVRALCGQSYPEANQSETVTNVVECLEQVVTFGQKYNITPLLESHTRTGAWQYYEDFCHTVELFMEIYEKTKDVDLKINMDTANMVAFNEDPVPILQNILPRLGTIQIADTSTRGALNHCLIGTGYAPIKEMLTIAKQAGYDGWLSIEEGSMNGMDGIAKAITYVRDTWNAI